MFAKPKAVKLLDGSPIANLLNAPKTTTATTKTAPTGPAKTGPSNPTTKTGTTTKPGTTGTGAVKKPAQNKLSDQLK